MTKTFPSPIFFGTSRSDDSFGKRGFSFDEVDGLGRRELPLSRGRDTGRGTWARWKFACQQSPLAACPQEVKDGVEDGTKVRGARSPDWSRRRQNRAQ